MVDEVVLMGAVAEALKARRGVKVAYLFGSFASGRAHARSDVDVGLLLDDGVEYRPHELSEIAGEIQSKANLNSEVEVTTLNKAGIRLLIQVVREGKPLYVGDEEGRVSFESNVLLHYLDYKPHLMEYDGHVKRRVTS